MSLSARPTDGSTGRSGRGRRTIPDWSESASRTSAWFGGEEALEGVQGGRRDMMLDPLRIGLRRVRGYAEGGEQAKHDAVASSDGGGERLSRLGQADAAIGLRLGQSLAA